MILRRPALVIFALAVGAFALAFLSQITAPRFASENDPGPRLLPLISGLAILLLGLIVGLRRVGAPAESIEASASRLKVLGMVGGLGLYLGLAPQLGFYLATIGFVLFFSRALGASWRVSALGSLFVSAICYGVFERGFHVALPRSALGLPF